MNKIIYTLLTIITFSCVSINANAFTTKGDSSCGECIRAKEQNKNNIRSINKDDIRSITSSNWFTGFMTGTSLGMGKDVLEDTDALSFIVWVDNYCRANPLENISSAGINLFLELEKQKGL